MKKLLIFLVLVSFSFSSFGYWHTFSAQDTDGAGVEIIGWDFNCVQPFSAGVLLNSSTVQFEMIYPILGYFDHYSTCTVYCEGGLVGTASAPVWTGSEFRTIVVGLPPPPTNQLQQVDIEVVNRNNSDVPVTLRAYNEAGELIASYPDAIIAAPGWGSYSGSIPYDPEVSYVEPYIAYSDAEQGTVDVSTELYLDPYTPSEPDSGAGSGVPDSGTQPVEVGEYDDSQVVGALGAVKDSVNSLASESSAGSSAIVSAINDLDFNSDNSGVISAINSSSASASSDASGIESAIDALGSGSFGGFSSPDGSGDYGTDSLDVDGVGDSIEGYKTLFIGFFTDLVLPIFPSGLGSVSSISVPMGGSTVSLNWGQYPEFEVMRDLLAWMIGIMTFFGALGIIRKGVA